MSRATAKEIIALVQSCTIRVVNKDPEYEKWKARKSKKRPKRRSRDDIPRWKEIRSEVVTRDEGRCRICGSLHGLHVHHIDWVRANNSLANLVTLCDTCHYDIHWHRYRPSDDEVPYPPPWGEHPGPRD